MPVSPDQGASERVFWHRYRLILRLLCLFAANPIYRFRMKKNIVSLGIALVLSCIWADGQALPTAALRRRDDERTEALKSAEDRCGDDHEDGA